MFNLTTLEYLKCMGVGIILIPFVFVSIVILKKTTNEYKNFGLGSAFLFLIFNIIFLIAPIGILFFTYLDKGLEALLISLITFFVIVSSAYIYENIIKLTFVLRIDEKTFYILYHLAKDNNVSIKDMILEKIKKD
ncbi:TPA: hypothetical protein ME607_003722 [Klebsiella pneumoniae]|jgi:hypothetical protein|uniref:hypothetical protein n=1 Tax=Klebsiella pneumoniae complex TaxID=3390273 RepID=UPI00068E4B99|nr:MULTISPECIES: hypothetical protein [Klebsiella]HBQ8857928.1 hypothetical protein [Klebsiella variicola subsp. variicola]HBY0530715.1 hypothetical protein [Klebsiella pneumoniae subsp. pneumoniae]ELA2144659.1 hypothetical protein [Klebsiella pneumoniae]ELA2697231.1 hypothetical protein [Klebsiella pneumoniae]MBZ1583253.1 hypothetical protein [Klebsiella pneumoniae]